jgi:uncharacterized protein with NAD-binding domain and iron-sulfur cluster
VTARELFKQFGVSQRLYRDAFNPMLLVGLFAPGEQCSAAAALGMLYYFILAHQPNFDVMWCRGTVGDRIFRPWCDRIKQVGGKILTNRRVSDVVTNETGEVTGVVCNSEVFNADAVIFSVGIAGMKKIVAGSAALQRRPEFRNIFNLGAVDVLATRLWFDRPVRVPRASNACFGFDNTTGWTFFDLNQLHDEHRGAPGTVIEADFYHANQFLPLDDADIVNLVRGYLATCVPGFQAARVTDSSVIRLRQAVTHFFPGCYQYLLRPQTSFNNVYASGDWIANRHGSWSQEKAYVTGLEAANSIIDRFGRGYKAAILPVEADEPHIEWMRTLNQTWREWGQSALPDFWLP